MLERWITSFQRAASPLDYQAGSIDVLRITLDVKVSSWKSRCGLSLHWYSVAKWILRQVRFKWASQSTTAVKSSSSAFKLWRWDTGRDKQRRSGQSNRFRGVQEAQGRQCAEWHPVAGTTYCFTDQTCRLVAGQTVRQPTNLTTCLGLFVQVQDMGRGTCPWFLNEGAQAKGE